MQHIDAVHLRHEHVEQDNVRLEFHERFERLGRVVDLPGHNAKLRGGQCDKPCQAYVIIDHKQSLWH